MPEGPSMILVKEAVTKFAGKIIISVSGNSKIDQSLLLNKEIIAIKSWGKHLLICLDGLTLRVHFLMFGSYTVDEKKPARLIRLNLTFKNGEINFYTCSLKYLEGDINQYYDWSADVMNDQWKIPTAKLNKLIDETRIYSFQFLEWKREYELKKHWLAHTKKICLRCNLPIIKKQTGLKKRRSFVCANCQTLYN